MSFLTVCSILCIAASGQAPEQYGSIGGAVRNASRGDTPVAHADVMLRIQAEGQWAPFRETKSDADGRFFFPHLPLGMTYRYLPGANRDGVHYPGPAMRLTTRNPHAIVALTVRDAVAEPCPLIVRRQRVSVHPEPGLLRVAESMLIENPSSTSYVGQPARPGGEPITLQLGIPADFAAVTFAEEFFGRRFAIVAGKLATGIPWTPGQRELKFSYVLRSDQRLRAWERRLDLPCEDFAVEVHAENPAEISCTLPKSAAKAGRVVAFWSAGQTLPAGQRIRVQFGRLPLPWSDYARWLSPVALLAMVSLAGYLMVRRQRADSDLGDS